MMRPLVNQSPDHRSFQQEPLVSQNNVGQECSQRKGSSGRSINKKNKSENRLERFKQQIKLPHIQTKKNDSGDKQAQV